VYGLVLKKAKDNFEQVMKISFGHTDKYNPMSDDEMPTEYCVGLLSPTSHILKPIANSFQPIEIPQSLFDKEIHIRNTTLIFYNPVVGPFGTYDTYDSYYSKDLPTVVPMFEMPLCEQVIWSGSTSTGAIFIELLSALNEVHKSGISLVDVSSRNLVVCNGKFKFIDVGFAKLYANILDHVDDPNFIFGSRKFRSPWAHIVSKIPTHLFKSTPWKLKEKLVLELIANDYWSLAYMFAYKFCKLRGREYITFTDHIDAAIDQIQFQRKLTYNNASKFTDMLQNVVYNLFSENYRFHTASCPESFQNILKSVLQVNPVIRMQNVERILEFNDLSYI